ncbi:MAG: tetratricopeptide repeat protein [Desulfuromonadales bacterium]|nr:tetratricopeptide repeat protein [Desulfuromonadales bacterium]
MSGALWRSAFVAACFALHPLHVESVVWIAERKDVLSTLFFLLTLFFYTRYVQHSKRSMYLLSLAAFVLGLMAKSMLVTLPVILLLLDIWPLQRVKLPSIFGADSGISGADGGHGIVSLKRLLLEKVPFLLLSAGSSIITVFAQHSGGAVATLGEIPVFLRSYNALWSTVEYLKKLFLPFDLAVYYPYALVPGWKAVFGAVLICALLAIVVWRVNKQAYLAVGWLWFLVTLLPVIGLVQVGSQAMADRYTYIPYIGIFIMIAWGGAEFAGKLKVSGRIAGLAAGGILLFFAVVTWNRLGYWQDNERLLFHTLEITRNNYFVHRVLGEIYEKQGKADLALAHYQEVIRINSGAKYIHLAVGSFLNNQGRPAEALEYLDEAIRRDPRNAEAHFYLGVVLEKLGRSDEAIAAYGEALKIAPGNAIYHTNLGSVLAQKDRLDEAVEHFTRALELNPNDRKAGENLQLALKLKGRKSGK